MAADNDGGGNGADIIDFTTARRIEPVDPVPSSTEAEWVAPPTMGAAIEELVQRGDRVLVQLPLVSFTGSFVEVNADFATLRTVSGTEIHVRIMNQAGTTPMPLILRITDRIRAAAPGAPPRGSVTLREAMRHFQDTETPVVMGSTLQQEQMGGHLTVGEDHIVLDVDGRSAMVIPFDAISWVGARNDRPALR
ncbi:MAG: hypothetical protein WBD02_01195 [Acidimicrobiia bacterium]